VKQLGNQRNATQRVLDSSVGTIVVALGGFFADGGAGPMIATIAACAILAWATTLAAVRTPRGDRAYEAA